MNDIDNLTDELLKDIEGVPTLPVPNENQPTPAARPDSEVPTLPEQTDTSIDDATQQLLDEKVSRAIPDAQRTPEKKTFGRWTINAWNSFWEELDDIRKANLGHAAEEMITEINYNPGGIFKALTKVLELESHYRTRTGFLGQNRKDDPTLKNIYKQRDEAYKKLAEEAPTLGNILWESYSVWGDSDKLLNTLYERPFRVLSTVLPYTKHLQKIKGTGKAARATRRAGMILPYTDPVEAPFVAGGLLGKAVAKWKNRNLAKEDYNKPFNAVYGRDTQTGDKLKTTQTPVEMADKIGTVADQTPAIVLSENPTVKHNEMIRHQTGGEDSIPVQQRFERSEKAYSETLDDITNREIDIARGLDSAVNNTFDIDEVGGAIRQRYQNWQTGKNASFRKMFGDIAQTLDVELRIDPDTFPLLSKTRAELDKLKNDHSRLSSGPRQSIQIAEQVLSEAFARLSNDGLTIRDFDQFRTEFRQKFEEAIHQAGLKPIGSGDPVSRLYQTLTEDFYDLVETEHALNPSDFPADFTQTIKDAKKEYAETLILEDKPAGKFIRRNLDTPHNIVNKLLNKNTSKFFIQDMKVILGKNGWDLVKPGLLMSFLDKANGSTKHFRWGGLKSEIAALNKVNKNRLRHLFGDELAKELASLGEFALKFSEEGRWTKGSPTGFVNRLVHSPSFLSLLNHISTMLPFMGGGYGGIKVGMGTFSLTDAALIAGMTTAFVGERWWNNYLKSDASRKWMLEGHSWDVVKRDGTVVTVTPEDFKIANEYMVIPFMKENKFRPKVGVRAAMRTSRSTERGRREQNKPKPIFDSNNPFGVDNPFRRVEPLR